MEGDRWHTKTNFQSDCHASCLLNMKHWHGVLVHFNRWWTCILTPQTRNGTWHYIRRYSKCWSSTMTELEWRPFGKWWEKCKWNQMRSWETRYFLSTLLCIVISCAMLGVAFIILWLEQSRTLPYEGKTKDTPQHENSSIGFYCFFSNTVAVCQPKPKSSPVAKFPIKSSISNNNNFLGGREVVR